MKVTAVLGAVAALCLSSVVAQDFPGTLTTLPLPTETPPVGPPTPSLPFPTEGDLPFPTGFPSGFPSDFPPFPTDLPSGFPTDLPPVPTGGFPGGDDFTRFHARQIAPLDA